MANVISVGGFLAREFKIPTIIMFGVLSDYSDNNFMHLTMISYIIDKLKSNGKYFLLYILKLFKCCDLDGNCYISPKDLKMSFGMSDEECIAVFTKYDVNRDQKLNLIDFMQFIIDKQ